MLSGGLKYGSLTNLPRTYTLLLAMLVASINSDCLLEFMIITSSNFNKQLFKTITFITVAKYLLDDAQSIEVLKSQDVEHSENLKIRVFFFVFNVYVEGRWHLSRFNTERQSRRV